MTTSLWAAKDAFVGDWKLDASRTSLPDQMTVSSVSGNKYVFNFQGTPETIAVDGTDQPGLAGTTLAVTEVGADSWKVVRKKDGRVLLTANWKLSPDGNTLADEFKAIKSDRPVYTLNYLYKRTAGTSGFAGTWTSHSFTTSSVLPLKVQPFEKDGLSFIDSFQEVTRNVKFDGRDYPDAGANIPAGFVSSARRVDDRTLEITDHFKGRVVDTQQVQLSPDRKTLTITFRAGEAEPNIFVYERR